MRRRSLAAFAALLTIGTLAACGQDDPAGGSSSDTGTISYFTYSAAPDHLKDLDAIKAAFEAQNPGIKVDIRTAAYTDYFTSLQTQVAGGKAPDTFELDYQNFYIYARNGALMALDDLAKADKSYDPARVYAKALTAFQSDGKQYAMPTTFSDVVLFYNKKLFDAAGVAYPTSSWTWSDEAAAAQKLTNKAAGVYGNFQPVTFNEFYKALNQSGGQFLSADGSKATFNDAKGVQAATWLTSKPGTVMPTVAEIGGKTDFDTALFKSGKLAMWVNGLWQMSGLADAKDLSYDIAVEPGNTQKASAVFMNATAVSAKSSKAGAAWKWITFLGTSQKTVETRLASSWELPAVNDQAAFNSYLQQPPANRKAVFDSLDAISLSPIVGDQQQKMQDIVTQALEKAAGGQASVQQALNDAANAVNDLLKH